MSNATENENLNKLESYIAMTRRNTLKLAWLKEDQKLAARANNASDDEVFFEALEVELQRWPEHWRDRHRKRILQEWVDYFRDSGKTEPYWLSGNYMMS